MVLVHSSTYLIPIFCGLILVWQDDFMNFIIMFMASPNFIRNPYLRAKMVEVLNCWMPRRRWFNIFHFLQIFADFLFLFSLLSKFQAECLSIYTMSFIACAVVHLLQLLSLKGTDCLLSILWEICWSFMLILSSRVLTHRWMLLRLCPCCPWYTCQVHGVHWKLSCDITYFIDTYKKL